MKWVQSVFGIKSSEADQNKNTDKKNPRNFTIRAAGKEPAMITGRNMEHRAHAAKTNIHDLRYQQVIIDLKYTTFQQIWQVETKQDAENILNGDQLPIP